MSAACSGVIPTLAVLSTIADACSGVIPTLVLLTKILLRNSVVNDSVIPSRMIMLA